VQWHDEARSGRTEGWTEAVKVCARQRHCARRVTVKVEVALAIFLFLLFSFLDDASVVILAEFWTGMGVGRGKYS
jgi:hypothetical protein